jgi:hypothetical protein
MRIVEFGDEGDFHGKLRQSKHHATHCVTFYSRQFS